MRAVLDPFSFVVLSIAGRMNRHQQHVIEYLIQENRVLREQIGNKRMRFTDEQRRRLAARAKELSRKTSWKEFLSRHWEQIVASDFFTIEVWTPSGLQRFVILFFIQLATRRVEIGGIARRA